MSKELPSKQERVLVDLTTDKEKYLVGWPGYRNARGRSGLGYVETQAEWAHMQGRMFRMLITGKAITHNPIFLFGMFIVGLIYTLPLILGLLELLNGNYPGMYVLFAMSPVWIFGLMIWGNVLFSLTNEDEEDYETEE